MNGMAKKKRIFSKPFAAAVDHHMRVQGWTNFDMGRDVGYTDGKMLSAIRLERSDGSEDRRRAIAEKLRFSLDAFIKEGERLIREQNKSHLTATLPNLSVQGTASNITDLDHQHWKVVKLFKQKETAKEINEVLVEIEAMDPDALRYILDEFKSRRDVIKNRIEADRKKRDDGEN